MSTLSFPDYAELEPFVDPELQPTPEDMFHLLSSKLFHKGLGQVDGRYLHIPTALHGVAKLTNYMSFEHTAYDREDSLLSLEKILAAGTPVLSLEFIDDKQAYLMFDPRFVSDKSMVKKYFLSQLRTVWGGIVDKPATNAQSVLFLKIDPKGVALVNPYISPHIQDLLAHLDLAFTKEASS